MVTLGIIGVVSAMTLPSLLADTRKNEMSARLKKFNSLMSQAVMMSENDNGPAEDWINRAVTNISLDEFFNQYFAPYLKYTEASYGTDHNSYYVYLADGSYFSLVKGNCVDITFDVNGAKKPNIMGRDKFYFLVCGNNIQEWCDGRHFCSYYNSNTSRDQRLAKCKSEARFCSGVLEMDNWEFKEDYPYRL